MRTALAISHVAFEDLGSLAPALERAGFAVHTRDAATSGLREDDFVTPDLLVVLGGPVGVYEQDAYPFLLRDVPHTFFNVFGSAPDLARLDLIEPTHAQAIGLVVPDRDPPSPLVSALVKSCRHLNFERRLCASAV